MLKKSHRLCLYYLPEIFTCFNNQQSSHPDVPRNLRTKFDQSGTMEFCWTYAQNDQSVSFKINIKEMPQMIMQGDVSLIKKSGETIQSQPLRTKRASIIVAHESVVNQKANFIELDSESVHKTDDGETCVSLSALNKDTRYLVFVEALNDQGNSEPSPPLFISTRKNETIFEMLNSRHN